MLAPSESRSTSPRRSIMPTRNPATRRRRPKAARLPGYIAYVLISVYAVNGARDFLAGSWQLLAELDKAFGSIRESTAGAVPLFFLQPVL